jgi:IclR family acetate operon transcriptional repressor
MTGNYRLGPALIPRPSQRLEAMRQHARPHIERLRDEFNETVNFGVLDGTHVYYVEIIESRRTVRLASSPAVRGPIHSTGLGKAIASQLPTEQVQWILSTVGMQRKTINTIATPEEYLLELDRIRDRGYAIDDRESTDEGRCVAVPFPGETLPAALSISAPAYRFPMDQVETVAVALKKAVLVIKDEIEGMSSSR